MNSEEEKLCSIQIWQKSMDDETQEFKRRLIITLQNSRVMILCLS